MRTKLRSFSFLVLMLLLTLTDSRRGGGGSRGGGGGRSSTSSSSSRSSTGSSRRGPSSSRVSGSSNSAKKQHGIGQSGGQGSNKKALGLSASSGFDASRMKVTGNGLVKGKTNVYNRFMINTYSAEDWGDGGLSLSIDGPSKAEIDHKDNQDGTVDVDYKPTEAGIYIISIKSADSHVPGSPFQVTISGEEIKRMKEAVHVFAKVVISSTGGAFQLLGSILGQYEYDEEHGYYIQTNTEQNNDKYQQSYLYQYEDEEWIVGSSPGLRSGWLTNWNTNKTVPTSGWQYYDYDGESWQDDPSLVVTPAPLPRRFNVTASGDAAEKWPSYLGVFTRTER